MVSKKTDIIYKQICGIYKHRVWIGEVFVLSLLAMCVQISVMLLLWGGGSRSRSVGIPRHFAILQTSTSVLHSISTFSWWSSSISSSFSSSAAILSSFTSFSFCTSSSCRHRRQRSYAFSISGVICTRRVEARRVGLEAGVEAIGCSRIVVQPTIGSTATTTTTGAVATGSGDSAWSSAFGSPSTGLLGTVHIRVVSVKRLESEERGRWVEGRGEVSRGVMRWEKRGEDERKVEVRERWVEGRGEVSTGEQRGYGMGEERNRWKEGRGEGEVSRGERRGEQRWAEGLWDGIREEEVKGR